MKFKDVRLVICASLPRNHTEAEKWRLRYLISDLADPLLRGGGRLAFGGHPTITPVIDSLLADNDLNPDQVEVHQLRRFKRAEGLDGLGPFTWYGDAEGRRPIGEELRTMRELMLADATAAVFVGGELPENSQTDPPGLREEFDIFRRLNPKSPAFLGGGLCRGYVSEHLVPMANRGEIDTHDGWRRGWPRLNDNSDAVANMILGQISRGS